MKYQTVIGRSVGLSELRVRVRVSGVSLGSNAGCWSKYHDVNMTSFGDTTEQLNVYLPWELKDAAGNDLDRAGRMKAFEEWVSRMLARHALWSKDGPEGADK